MPRISVLMLLLAGAPSRRLMRFAVSGAGGVALNLLTYELLVVRWGWQPLPAGLVSRHVPMAFSFLLAQRWVWSDREDEFLWHTLGRFLAVSEFGAVINIAVIAAFQYQGWRIPPWDNLAGILAAFLLSYLLNDRWTFVSTRKAAVRAEAA